MLQVLDDGERHAPPSSASNKIEQKHPPWRQVAMETGHRQQEVIVGQQIVQGMEGARYQIGRLRQRQLSQVLADHENRKTARALASQPQHIG
jgi:hypothetical protein